ncbi:MAG: septum formation initiator family protein [Clostridia bacterium]|nr:septum formation initiator family protein [Clostridia bacterium]
MKKKNFKIYRLIFVSVVICIVFSAFYNVFAQISDYNKKNSELAEQIAVEKRENKQLQDEKLNMHSDENYKRIARKTLGLVEPGDKVYINSNDNK